MTDETFRSNSECESSSHQEHLCYIVSQGFHLTNEAEYQALVKNPQFKCQKCGRLAKEQIHLCKPVKLSADQKDDCEELRNRMMKIKSVDELLDFVIIQEIRAYELYIRMASIVKNPWMNKVLESFAREELQHKQKLEAVKANKIVLEQIDVEDHVSNNTLENTKPHADMDYSELLAYAIQKENRSYRLYTSMASKFSEPEMRDIFLKLAQEEANHKQRLEFEYNMLTS